MRMRGGLRSILVLVVTVCLLNEPAPAGAAAPTPAVEPPFAVGWQATWPGEGAVRAIVARIDAAYALTSEGIVHAVSTTDGRELWRTSGWLAPHTTRCPYDPPQMRSSDPSSVSYDQSSVLLAESGGTVIASVCAGSSDYVTDRSLLLLDAKTGRLTGSWPVMGGRLAGVEDGVMVIQTRDAILGVSVGDPKEIWRVQDEQGGMPALIGVWEHLAYQVRYDPKTYQPFLVAHAVMDGKVQWEADLKGLETPRFAAHGWVLAVRAAPGADQGQLVAIDDVTGETAWEVDLPLNQVSASSVDLAAEGDRLYVYAGGAGFGLMALDLWAQTATPAWTVPADVAVYDLRASGQYLYYLGMSETATRLYVARADSGEVVWSGLPQPGEKTYSGQPRSDITLGPSAGDTLYVGVSAPGTAGSDARLICLRPH
jgi:outer membrane protein assembly factor BamB